MALIAINGVILEPQPAWDEWQSEVVSQLLNGTESVGAFQTFVMRCPPLGGQDFNWTDFENQELTSLQTYPPGGLPTDAAVVYSSGVVSRKIETFTSPLDRSVTGVELRILVNVEDGS